jgi:nucleoid-associated protein YgaU
MGRLEKIVVLTVLFLVAVILGVSLNQGGDPLEPALEGAAPDGLVAEAPSAGGPDGEGAQPAGGATERGGEATQPGPSGLLFGGIEQEQTPRQDQDLAGETAPEPVPEPAQAPVEQPVIEQPVIGQPVIGQPVIGQPVIGQPVDGQPAPQPAAPAVADPGLLTTEGLTKALVPDLMIYTWAQGDSFPQLAERYFGSSLEVGRLRKANEGRDEASLQVGDRIFVPVRASAPTERLTRDEQVAGEWDGGVYRVKAGDMLGKIAQEVYGSASRWRLIYEANRDVLASPDDLKVGMALRIPRVD